jgi:hypothetical protein
MWQNEELCRFVMWEPSMGTSYMLLSSVIDVRYAL